MILSLVQHPIKTQPPPGAATRGDNALIFAMRAPWAAFVAFAMLLLKQASCAMPTLPAMSDDATIHIEANIVNKNYTVHITEYHDYSNGAGGMLRRDEARFPSRAARPTPSRVPWVHAAERHALKRKLASNGFIDFFLTCAV